jgi:uncharacterized protein YbcI
MKEIIDLITAQQEEAWNPRIGNPYDPRILAFGQLSPNGIATAVLKILSSSLPKLSSVQTIIDRLFRAIGQRDQRIIEQSTGALVNLFANFNTPENRAVMTQFKDEYINRANTIIQRQARQNEINYANQMRINNAEEAADKKSQRVYVINPANDPVNVADINAMGGAPPPVLGNPPPLVQPGVLIPQAPVGPAPAPVGPVRVNGGQMDQRQWTNYVGQMVMALGPANLDALYRGIPNDPNLRNIDPIRFRFGVQGATDAEKQQACIQALVLNFGNANYGPHAGVGNILHNRALGLGLGKKEKKGRGLYSPFGDSEINHKNLENNILTLRRKSKTNYMDLPSKHISKHMKNIIHNIVGGKIANYEDLHNLTDEEKNYLHKVISKSNLHDRLSVPAPSKDQADKDNHQWEVMRGEIMAGNDSHELVKKFKILTMKLTRQGLLPKNEVMDLFEDLVNLGY